LACCTWAFYKQTNQPKHTSPHTLQPNKLTKHKLSDSGQKWATTTSCATLSPRSKVREPIGARMKQHPPNAQCRMNGMWTGNTFLLYSLSPPANHHSWLCTNHSNVPTYLPSNHQVPCLRAWPMINIDLSSVFWMK